MRRAPASLLAFLLIAAAPPAGPEEAKRQAEQAEAARAAALAAHQAAAARAAEAAAAADTLASERVKAAARLRAAEAATLRSAERMAALARAQREAEARLAARSAAIAPLLPLAERLSLYPAETLLAVPASPEDAVRGLIVLRGIARRLEAEAAGLRREQAALAAARGAAAAEAPRLAQAERDQQDAAQELDRQLAAADLGRRAAEADSAAAERRAAQLGEQAESLRALVARLEAERAEAEARARAEAARAEREKRRHPAKPSAPAEPVVAARSGPLLVPVTGTLVRGWGQPTEAGPSAGLTYRAAPKARVVAPCDGRVAFAAPFRSYGKLLILDCGAGTDAVLSGFERLDVRPGQSLRRGQTVGVMPGWDPASQGDRPTLYVELRRRGEPVNPAPLMRAS
ncbi:MAG: peptidoglycan DD-metalloendopeptidase family protein [Acetobacteraceae bacterium]|nr:peptidoglycan DD-metalloendopeptidase family protein [Acetobacteraceae bacterium]